jgi:D-glycero-beta-D-manno-heptose-7-phosphate kinase
MKSRPAAAPGPDATRLLSLIGAFKRCRIAVIGDLLADEFIYGRVERVSREAPVLILRYDQTTVVPGGAGNAAANAAALGADVHLAGLAGRDEVGRRLLVSLPRRVARRTVLRPAGYHTPVKTRILAGGIHSAKQQVVRIDRLRTVAPTAAWRRSFLKAARAAVRRADAVIVSDYGSGLVTPALAEALRSATARQRVPVLLDSRHDTLGYRGLAACTPNESEVEQMLGFDIGDDPEALERAGRALLRRTAMDAVLITRGSRGMALFESGRPTVHIPIFGSDEIADVTGAGDTVIAALAVSLASGGSFLEAARLANYAGGLVVMKRGTATVGASELRRAVRADARG